jgi:peptidyl-prolyl cis-trans isomerase C
MKKTSLVILTLTAAASVSFAADAKAPAKIAASKVIKATVPMMPKANFDFLPAVVAEVNGKKLTKAEVIQKIFSRTGGKIPQGVNQKMLVDATKQMATQFVQTAAILDAAIKAGFKPSAELAVKGFKDYLKAAPPFQVEYLKKNLAQQGMTVEAFIAKNKDKKQFQDQMTINSFFEKTIISKCKVSEKDAKVYYDANPKQFETPADPKDSMRASHILIMAKEKDDAKTKAAGKAKAEKLLALLKKDSSLFEELAEKESGCPSGKNKGSLGAFKKGQMVPAFEQAVVNLKTGEISAVVETKFGYHIIRRDASQKSKKKTYAEVKDKLQVALKQKEIDKALMVFVKKITDAAKGKIYIK